MYIGNIPDIGGTVLAGVGVCGPIVTLISSFAFLIGIGGAPLMSMRMGEGNKKGAQQILANCFVLLLGLSVTLAAVFFVAKQHLLYWFGASEVTYPYANEYLSVYLAGTVFALLSVGLNQFIVCQGFSTIAMTSVLIGAVCNILLDPVFIFLFDMGVTGAALATVLSQAASCFFTLTFLFGRRTRIKITFGGYSWRIMRRVMIFGLSPFLIAASDSVILIVFNSVLQRYGGPQNGDTYVACATIVQSYMQIITLPLGGITGGTQPVLSFNYGAKRTDRIKSGFRNILTLCILFNGIMFLLSQIVPQLFVRIFTQDPQYLEFSAWGIRVFTAGGADSRIPVYLCRRVDCAGHCKGCCDPIAASQGAFPGRNGAAAAGFRREGRIFRRADCGYCRRNRLHYGICPVDWKNSEKTGRDAGRSGAVCGIKSKKRSAFPKPEKHSFLFL